MANNKNINIHPALSPRLYVIILYNFYRVNNITKEEVEENDKVLTIQRIYVDDFNEIKTKVCDALNLPSSAKVTINPIGEEDFDEGFTFGNSIVVEVETEEYTFNISFDCYTSFNAFQWGENADWAKR